MLIRTVLKAGEYHDSVALMLVARELGAQPGVADASVVMATPSNKALLEQAGLLAPEGAAAGPNDLLLVVRAEDAALADAALAQAQALLAKKASTASSRGAAARPRSLRSAARSAPGSNIAVISVAGRYAVGPAWDALRAGMHVLLFSDHVSVDDELALKTYARDHGLLLMGPGAGTAILNGVGLGFANAVPQGPVGIAAAAGTGLQEVSTLLAKAGLGITQGLGTGGRDVSEKLGALMLVEAFRALQDDPATEVVVIVTKIPSQKVEERIIGEVSRAKKPTVIALMGAPRRVSDASGLTAYGQLPAPHFEVTTLREAAAFAAALARHESVDAARARLAAEDREIVAQAATLRGVLRPGQRYLRGLYSGGTLCEETMRLWAGRLGEIYSNAPIDPRWQLADSLRSQGHTVIDLGEEEFTQGRPHPMIDCDLRIRRMLAEARDPEVAALVLDVVIGHGSHVDPAAELGPAIVEARRLAAEPTNGGRALPVIFSVTGTEEDPQGLSRQFRALTEAGATGLSSNAAAALLALNLVSP